MAAGRSGKIPPVRARAGLFLTEALVGIVIFATLAGAVVISCVDIKALYTDRQSDENIARDVREPFLVEVENPPKDATRAVVTFIEDPTKNK